MQLRGPGVEQWAERLGPFLEPHGNPDFSVTIDINLDDPRPLPGAFTYRRHDLTFAATADRGHALHTGHPDSLLAILELALAAALPDGLLIHAAAAVIDHRAWLLPGPSGTGKSTAIRAIPHHRALSDERVVARPRPDGWRAYGTPWWSSGRARPLDAGSAPIAGLIALRHGPPAITPLPADAAAAALVESTALYFDPARAAAFAAACDLAEAIDAVTLTFCPDTDWPALLAFDRAHGAQSPHP